MPTNTSGASSSGAAARALSRPQGQPAPAGPAPPGFETFYLNERSKLTTSFEAFVLPLHWSLVRGGLRLRVSDANPTTATLPMSELSENLPTGWKSKITTKPEEGSEQQLKQLVLRYWDHSNANIHYEAKILELVKNNAVVVVLFRAVNSLGNDGNVQVANTMDMDSNSPGRNASASTFQLGNYLSATVLNPGTGGEYSMSPAENKTWHEVFKNLQAFERNVWEQLMDPIGLCVNGRVREPGPYESNPSGQNQQQQPQQQQQQQQQPRTPVTYVPPPPHPVNPYPAGGIGPLYNPPAVPLGGGGLGRNDLDPLGGFGAGNVADPRGFRAPPTLPYGGGIGGGNLPPPPGARYDPFGPPNPIPPGARPQPGAGGGGNNWAVPNPDAEQPPPGFEDMFM